MFLESIHRYSSSAAHKVIIVDWDDTILPSSFVDRWQIETSKDLPLHFQNLLDRLGRCAEKFLEEASQYGEVIIITNSDEGWVKFSAERFVPNLVSIIEKYRVISARTRYERFYPGHPLCWKAAAFAHEVNEIYESLIRCDDDDMNTSCGSMVGTDGSSTSSEESIEMEMDSPPHTFIGNREIISFGDSTEERNAVLIVSEQFKALPKSVMFMNSPTPSQIIGQLSLLTNHMKFICESSKSLDIEITPEQADRCADSYMKRNQLSFDRNSFSCNIELRPRIQTSVSESSDAVVAPLSG